MAISCTPRSYLDTTCLICPISLIKKLDWKLTGSGCICTVSWGSRLERVTFPAQLYAHIHTLVHAQIAFIGCLWLGYQHPSTIKAPWDQATNKSNLSLWQESSGACGQGQEGSLMALATTLLLWCMPRDSEGLNFLHGRLWKSHREDLQPFGNRVTLDLCRVSALYLKCRWYAMFVYHF